MKRRLRALVCSVVCVCLGWVGSAYGDAVTDWSAIAVDALNAAVPPRPGPTGLLDMAVVQLAVHNAVAAIDGRFQPYYLTIAGASGSPVAATAKAAHDVLVNRFPTQAASLDSIYDNYLSANNLAQDDPGVAVGQAAAAGIIALRADDGSFPSPAPSPYTGGTDNGVWRPTPAPFAPMAVPWLAHVRPFALDNPWQLRAGPPPSLTSDRYTQDYNEVKALGLRRGVLCRESAHIGKSECVLRSAAERRCDDCSAGRTRSGPRAQILRSTQLQFSNPDNQ